MAGIDFSIVSGWFPFVLFWLTVVVSIGAVVRRRGLLGELALGLPLGMALIGGLYLLLRYGVSVPAGAPRSMYLWLEGACVLAGLVIAGWPKAHLSQRFFGVTALILAVLSAGSAVNQNFQYYPTLSRLFGKEANHFLDNSALNALRTQVARTGKLPDHGATLAVAIPPAQGTTLNYTPEDAYVWVPPAWFSPSAPKLPVVELLPGTPGSPSDWTRAAFADSTSLAFAEAHHGVAPILVMPDINGSFTNDTECVNSSKYGDVETYITQDVPAFMRANFNASTKAHSVAIAGLSEGGTCAVTLALNNPAEYNTFASYSGFTDPTYQTDNADQTKDVLFGGSEANYDAHDPRYLLTHGTYPGMAGWFESGSQDPGSVQAQQTLQPLAQQAGIATCITTKPGGHDFGFWKQAFSDSLPWMSWRLGLTPEPNPVGATCVAGSAGAKP